MSDFVESGEVLNAEEMLKSSEKALQERFAELQEVANANQARVLKAFQEYQVNDSLFAPSTGYGYNDRGRECLEEIYADVFSGQEALVRSQIVSGTHAISACLFALLRPGDVLLSLTGSPYDTLTTIIGKHGSVRGSLLQRGVGYQEVALNGEGRPDFAGIARKVAQTRPRLALIQRSRGYSIRPALDVASIEKIAGLVREQSPETVVMLDNCYGEFTEVVEPGEAVDLMAGSLIKNPGGGLAPAGGYICGQEDLVEQVADHLTAPGLGRELGASLISSRSHFQGFFLAPHVVLQALKGALLVAHLFQQAGYRVYPSWEEQRADIVQGVELRDADEVLRFCQVVQSNSPVDNHITLEYAAMPGYQHQVVMAAGTFIQGSSIELSCDAPLRSPYIAYLQGGLTYEHCRIVAAALVEEIILKQ